MRTRAFCGRFGRLVCMAVIAGGCGPSPEVPPAAEPAAEVAAPAGDFESLIGTYMPPLEGGRLEIAAPEGWGWARPGSGYLVGFTPGKASLNDLPRILISTDDVPPYPGIEHVDASNVEELVQQVDLAVGGDALESPPQALQLGDNHWVEYVSLRRSRDVLVNQMVLETVAHGRWYAIRLEVSQRQFSSHRPHAHAVAASCRFSSEADLAVGEEDFPENDDS